ncbi:hypothetical protein ZIOFF_008114 [Zingiber officinale]|uniref:Uncharacterized protein n=1 Tax=Zingiber officinale TaxID=94328 RepID=A0A8J5HS82_ZINOF|nr:hypothetical protein ZIOFF_008114 [Zingiber officinale]
MAMVEEELQSPSEKTTGLDFARLKSYCLELFDLLRNPKKDAAFLAEMADFLRRTPASALQTSLDYIIMPLLLLLDSAVQCRKKKVNPEGNPLGFIEIRDSVAEGMLMCLEELFKKCYLGSVDQVCDFGIIFPYVSGLSGPLLEWNCISSMPCSLLSELHKLLP